MRHKILAYGSPALTKTCTPFGKDTTNIEQLINDMWETMKNANGCGLAAPQIGINKKLFVVDSKTTFDLLDEQNRQVLFHKGDNGIRETFINAEIIDYDDDLWEDDEGCLSIPGIYKPVKRSWSITIRYQTKNFQSITKSYSGTTARMIQHEFDHTQGVLFLNYLKPLTKRLLESKLKKIKAGKIQTRYPMKFI